MEKLSNERLEVLNAERAKLGLDRIVSLLNIEEAELYKGNIQEARDRANKNMARYENKNGAMYRMNVETLERMNSLEAELLAHIEKLNAETKQLKTDEQAEDIEVFETEKIKELDASLVKALSKVAKIENTIARHHKQLEKKVTALSKLGYNIDYSNVNFKAKTSFEFNNEIKHINSLKWVNDKSVPEYWELCEVVHKLESINNSNLKLEEAKHVVTNWKKKKDAATKERKRILELNKNVPSVIIEYVDQWGQLAKEWHMKNDKKVLDGSITEEALDRTIKEEKEYKVAELISLVMDVVGVITDAKGLTIGAKGQLNGFIIGTHGKAEINTVAAGGWNIQKFHFRTLINKI